MNINITKKLQVLHTLFRFTKNLSPNKISVKFLKGEGELHNLELDETTLAELLELPPWIRLTKATCNRISAKIHWTRLKTDPICLYLDSVEVDMEAMDGDVNTPSPSSPQTHPPNAPHQPPIKEKAPNRYGFVEKVVDGMFVQINSVVISFKFQAFLAKFQMSRLVVRSTTPKWQPDDLRLTRVKDETRGEVLTFKEITWQTLRIDANALYNETLQQQSNPLRLITSQSSLHLTIKKRLDDCAVLSARLELLLDDILWVLTQSQLQALSGLLHSVNQAMSHSKVKKEPGTNSTQHSGQASQQQTHYTGSTIHEQKSDFESLNALFTRHDVRETSYLLRTGSIDLHLCDDSEDRGADGGAMHFKMNKLSVDYFPYHLAGTSRNDWPSHNEASLTRAYWVNDLLSAFRNSQRNKQLSPQKATQSHHRARSDGSVVDVSGRDGSLHPSPPSTPSSPYVNSRRTHPSSPGHSANTGKTAHSIKNNSQRPVFMLESCFVIRCEEFFIMPVTTSNGSKEELPAFLSSDKKALFLPSDMPAFQLDFTQYYYPGSVTSAVPTPNLFIQLNPIQLTLDTATCLWFSSFMRSILGQTTWSRGPPEQATCSSPSDHIDIRIEALMPKLVIPCPSDPCAAYKDSRPQGLQVQVSQVFITNSRIGNKSTQTDMLMFLQPFLGAKTYTDFQNFPSMPADVQPLPNSLWINDCSLLSKDAKNDKHLNGVCQDISGTHQPSQVWCLSAEQVWFDFLGIDEIKNRPISFIDAVPVQIWIATPLPFHDHNTTVMNTTAEGIERTSWLTSPTHRRTASEILSPKRKGSEPVITMKSRTNTGTLLSTATNVLHSSDPNISSNPSEALDNTTRDGPPPAYEPRNEPRKPFPVVSEPPPPYETLTHHEPDLAGAPSEEVSSLSRKAFISGDTPNGLSESEGSACQEPPSGSQADLSFLIHIPQTVKIQLDHFQFLFLVRLQEKLSKLQEDLEKDRLRRNNADSELNESKNAQPSLFFSILTRGVDLNVVLPPAPDGDGSREGGTPSESTSRNASSLSSYLDTGVVLDSGCQSPDVIDFKTLRPDSEEAMRKDGSVCVDDRDAKSSEEVPPSPRASSAHTSGRTSAASAPDSDGWLVVPACDKLASGSVKSRADSEASNFSSQLGSSISKGSSSKDVEVEHKDPPKMVSIFSIEGEDVELGIHFQGNDTVVKILCPELKWEELGVINFEKYLNRKSFRKSLTKTTIPTASEGTPMMRMRMEFGPCAERYERTAAERGFMHIKVNGVNGSLLVSTLGNMAEWIEDEVVLPPMPFLVEVNNSRVSINNDLPPTLVSAPVPIPVDLTVENISVSRTHDGVLHIRPMSNESIVRESEQASVSITREESISASQLSLSDSASVSSRTESLENEKQSLMSQMAVSRAALQSLQEERDALLKTIERLQQELSFSNREQDLLQERMTSFQKGGRRGYR